MTHTHTKIAREKRGFVGSTLTQKSGETKKIGRKYPNLHTFHSFIVLVVA
jgi:hypothetical protein